MKWSKRELRLWWKAVYWDPGTRLVGFCIDWLLLGPRCWRIRHSWTFSECQPKGDVCESQKGNESKKRITDVSNMSYTTVDLTAGDFSSRWSSRIFARLNQVSALHAVLKREGKHHRIHQSGSNCSCHITNGPWKVCTCVYTLALPRKDFRVQSRPTSRIWAKQELQKGRWFSTEEEKCWKKTVVSFFCLHKAEFSWVGLTIVRNVTLSSCFCFTENSFCFENLRWSALWTKDARLLHCLFGSLHAYMCTLKTRTC